MRDWSLDVCSSDISVLKASPALEIMNRLHLLGNKKLMTSVLVNEDLWRMNEDHLHSKNHCKASNNVLTTD